MAFRGAMHQQQGLHQQAPPSRSAAPVPSAPASGALKQQQQQQRVGGSAATSRQVQASSGHQQHRDAAAFAPSPSGLAGGSARCGTSHPAPLVAWSFCRTRVAFEPSRHPGAPADDHERPISCFLSCLALLRRGQALVPGAVGVQLKEVTVTVAPQPALRPAPASTKPVWFAPSGQRGVDGAFAAPLVGRPEPLGASLDATTVSLLPFNARTEQHRGERICS